VVGISGFALGFISLHLLKCAKNGFTKHTESIQLKKRACEAEWMSAGVKAYRKAYTLDFAALLPFNRSEDAEDYLRSLDWPNVSSSGRLVAK
jgi:hypothetical protein